MAKNQISKHTFHLFKKVAGAVAPPSSLTVSQWADENRVLNNISAEPGRWRTSRFPYMREVMDCLSVSSPVQDITLMKGAQISGSESGNNWIGYVIDQEPGSMMLVQPTVELAKRYSKKRIAPMITDSPALRGKVKEARVRDSGNTVLEKDFPGGSLIITGANSAAGLRMMPVRYLFLDEIDAYVEDCEGEGDPVDLATARTRNFARRKIFKCSTPIIKNKSRIEADYLDSDQRKYFVPCPHCEHRHVLTWDHFIIPTDETGKKRPDRAHMVCPSCGGIIQEYHKPRMFELGEWRPTAPKNSNPRKRGYHISTLYSPVGFFSWAECAEEWLKAQKETTRLKTFINTILGETWEEKGETLDADRLAQRRERYNCEVPAGVLVLTAAVDVQDDRLEAEVVGWGQGKESWGVKYTFFFGDLTQLKSLDPAAPSPWEQLDTFLQQFWSYADGTEIGVSCTCIDSGGHFTSEVYDFVKPREHRRIFAIKGKPGAGVPIIGKPSRSNRKKVPLFPVGVDTAKEQLFTRLKTEFEGPGYCHFPIEKESGYDEAYFAGLTSEKKVEKFKKGRKRMEWEKKSSSVRNEPLDLRNYATAALEILNPNLEALSNITRERKKPAASPSVPGGQRRRRRVLSGGVSM